MDSAMDAALDFPLFLCPAPVAKSFADVATIRQVFDNRSCGRAADQLHGEAGKYFVSFLDNHDQDQRFNHPGTPPEQVLIGLAVLFCMQGIPCLYYGTEQGLDGTKHADGTADTSSPESVREASGVWTDGLDAIHSSASRYPCWATLRKNEPALQSGRLYFRRSLAMGRISVCRRASAACWPSPGCCSTGDPGGGQYVHQHILSGASSGDVDINRELPDMKVAYSNVGTTGRERFSSYPSEIF